MNDTPKPTLKDLLDRGAKLYAAGNSPAAAGVYRAALKIAPKDPTVRLRHAIAIWHGEDRSEDALREIRSLAKEYPQAAVLAHEALILNSLGRFEEAAIAARGAIDADPNYSSAWLDLATASAKDAAPALADELRTAISKRPDAKIARDLQYALAQTLRKLDDEDGAFLACSEGNRLSQNRWEAKREGGTHTLLKTVFDAALLQRLQGQGSPDERMIFVSGMPRSGTTLLDRLLSAHPVIHSVGETTAIGNLFNHLFAQTGKTASGANAALNGPVLQQMATAYLNGIAPKLQGQRAARIIDKMPANTMFWPLIALMFPRATILHMQRHPLGTCLSCWEASFAFGLDYATDMQTLGQAYRQYADLTDQWKRQLGERIQPVVYEQLVKDPETVLRKMLDRIGLPFDARCLQPDSSGPIKTASVAQARAPVGTGSLDRWREFEDRLEPVAEAMGGTAWVEARWNLIKSQEIR
ncbi:MAG: sulfotransferase [Pseudomonadota bacterium]